jgi:hypothetical protein
MEEKSSETGAQLGDIKISSNDNKIKAVGQRKKTCSTA